jgi:hypothetical protein
VHLMKNTNMSLVGRSEPQRAEDKTAQQNKLAKVEETHTVFFLQINTVIRT